MSHCDYKVTKKKGKKKEETIIFLMIIRFCANSISLG